MYIFYIYNDYWFGAKFVLLFPVYGGAKHDMIFYT